jgi:thiol:disulfide interchange protein DsbD
MLVFFALGLGMALPVLALSFFPRWLRVLPKPGAWMETFKQVLAFPLYATVAWLAWVLGNLGGIDAVFAMLGFGMAVPVLLLALFPALLKRLPRPGAWMETFKQVLAFPLYGTVAWLAWVLGAQASNDAVLALLAGLVLIAMAAWFYGRWAHAGRRWQPALAILLAGVGLLVAWPSTAPANAHGEGALAWQEWSPEKVADLTARGTPVFVDFTAAWCVTCQVNKRVALNDKDVVKAFASRDLTALKADWTRQDPRITRTLAELGRNAVPVYALYVPGQPAPHLLPEVLTPSIVVGEVSQLPARSTALTQR